jgi:hypothetical protein
VRGCVLSKEGEGEEGMTSVTSSQVLLCLDRDLDLGSDAWMAVCTVYGAYVGGVVWCSVDGGKGRDGVGSLVRILGIWWLWLWLWRCVV